MKKTQYISSDFLTPRDAWDKLSIEEQAAMMKAAVSEGILDLNTIRQKYNEFAEGGSIDTDWSYNSWKRQIAEHMGIRPDEDNTYDYEAYFNKYPEEAWKMLKGDPSAHFSDEFKTVYHPTFSSKSIGNDGSIYSGVRNPKTNPQGLKGGTWSPDYKEFTMSEDGYRGPVSMDDRAWYLMNNEDNGAVLRKSDGTLPLFDGIPWASVLPNVTIIGNKTSINSPLVKTSMNEYKKGGGIHIKDSKKGTFTAAASKHGMGVQEFASRVLAHPENYSPAMRKKANFARNASKWKHAYGGELGNYYDGGGILDKIFGWLGLSSEKKEENKPVPLTYRNKPASITRVITPEKQYLQKVPKRIRANTSKTKDKSERYENEMRLYVTNHQGKLGGSNPVFDIPYIPEKKILIGSTITSTNALDSLAKYAGIHNRNPKLSEHPIKRIDTYPAPRQINKNEMLGLSFQETSNGAWPFINTGHGENDRAIANSNYFTAFGYIPADNFMRDFHYNDTGVNRSTPPILDAFRYYAQGDYNRKDPNHTKDVNAAGKRVWENQDVKNWWELSGKYWYNNGKGPSK